MKSKFEQCKVKIWVDDLRPVPVGYVGVKSVNETIALIEQIESDGGSIALLDLDHDLGDYAEDGGDAIKILDYLVERETYYPIEVHTANPVGRANMDLMKCRQSMILTWRLRQCFIRKLCFWRLHLKTMF